MAKAAAAASGALAMSSRRPASPTPTPTLPRKRAGLRWGWANGAADFIHDPRAALHEDLWPDAGAIGDGLRKRPPLRPPCSCVMSTSKLPHSYVMQGP